MTFDEALKGVLESMTVEERVALAQGILEMARIETNRIGKNTPDGYWEGIAKAMGEVLLIKY